MKRIILLPGGRADVAIRCSSELLNRTVVLTSVWDNTTALGYYNFHQQSSVMMIQFSPAPANGSALGDFPNEQAPLPPHLRDTRDRIASLSAVRKIVMSGHGGKGNNINGVPFEGFHGPVSSRYLDSLVLGQTYEYVLQPHPMMFYEMGKGMKGPRLPAPLAVHPYHQHVHPFQIVSLNGAESDIPGGISSDIIRVGEWRDVAPAMGLNGVTIRFIPSDFDGYMMVHCHMLQHEDTGMMALIDVQKSSRPDVTSADATSTSTSTIVIYVTLTIAAMALAIALVLQARRRWCDRSEGDGEGIGKGKSFAPVGAAVPQLPRADESFGLLLLTAQKSQREGSG